MPIHNPDHCRLSSVIPSLNHVGLGSNPGSLEGVHTGVLLACDWRNTDGTLSVQRPLWMIPWRFLLFAGERGT